MRSGEGSARTAASRSRLTARHWADAERAGELAKQLGSYRAEVHGITFFFARNTAKPRHPNPGAAAAARSAQRPVEQAAEPSPTVPKGAGNARQRRAAKRSAAKHLRVRQRLQSILHKALRAARWRRMQGVWTAWMSTETALVVAAGGQSSLPAGAAGKRRWSQGREEPGCPVLPPVPAAAVAASHSPGASSTPRKNTKRSVEERSPVNPAGGAAQPTSPTSAGGKQPRALSYIAAVVGGDGGAPSIDYRSWKVPELKSELERRGLSSEGLKRDLIARCETTPALALMPPT